MNINLFPSRSALPRDPPTAPVTPNGATCVFVLCTCCCQAQNQRHFQSITTIHEQHGGACTSSSTSGHPQCQSLLRGTAKDCKWGGEVSLSNTFSSHFVHHCSTRIPHSLLGSQQTFLHIHSWGVGGGTGKKEEAHIRSVYHDTYI